MLEKHNLQPYWLYYQVVAVETGSQPIIYSALKLDCITSPTNLVINGVTHIWSFSTGNIRVWYSPYPKITLLKNYPNYIEIPAINGQIISLRCIKDFWMRPFNVTCIPSLTGGTREVLNRFCPFIQIRNKAYNEVNIEINLKTMKVIIVDQEIDIEAWNLFAFLM